MLKVKDRPRGGLARILQVKIAELPVDMFRMMQTLEWSHPALDQHGHDEGGSAAAPLESGGRGGGFRQA